MNPAAARTPPAQRGRIFRALLAAAAVALVASACERPNGEPAAEAATDPTECERLRYPCSWTEVDIEIARRIDEMSSAMLELMYRESPTALWEWLQTIPDIVDAGVEDDSAAIWFRLEGGRRVYVFGPHRHRPEAPAQGAAVGAASLPRRGQEVALQAGLGGMLAAVADLRPVARRRTRAITTHPADVTGRDRNLDERVNQRDQRRALVMNPLYFELCYQSIEDRYSDPEEKIALREAITAICERRASPATLGLTSDQVYAHGARVGAELEGIPAYSGNVTILMDQAAHHDVIRTWDTYDVVHLTTHGSATIWAFGQVAEMPEGDDWLPPPGPFTLVLSKAGEAGPERVAWAVGLPYIRSQLENGLDRTLLFASACETQALEGPEAETPELIRFLAGTNAGALGWKTQIPYDENEIVSVALHDLLSRGWTVRQAIDSLLLRRSEFLEGAPDSREAYLLAEHLEYHGRDLRIFEIPTLVDPTSVIPGGPARPLSDGAPLTPPLLAGAPGDEVDDKITVDVEVVAITDQQAPSTSVHLELDRVPIGSAERLSLEAKVAPNKFRVRFDGVPVGKDLQVDTDYELEAVVALPEGGESRHAVRLRSETCVVPSQGDYQGELTGARARVIESGSRGAFAKILRSPLGGWRLQLESRERDGRDLTLGLAFDADPVPGTSVFVTGTGLLDPSISGQVDRFDRPRLAAWTGGGIEVRFDAVEPRDGKPFRWVCGRIDGHLTGVTIPEDGVSPVPIAGSFDGTFRAEWYPNR